MNNTAALGSTGLSSTSIKPRSVNCLGVQTSAFFFAVNSPPLRICFDMVKKPTRVSVERLFFHYLFAVAQSLSPTTAQVCSHYNISLNVQLNSSKQ